MALGVAAGAFGAHALRDRLAADMLTVYQTGVLYHLVHGLGALLAAVIATTHEAPRARMAGWLLLAGVVLFSGSLYVLAFTGARWLGAVTPLGGLAWVAGWVVLALAAWTRR
jgi:uncharacterized membrane protein YgdD (TMEM256/DUF423 family)